MVGTHQRAGHDPDDMQAPGENRIRHVVIQRRRQDENKRGEKGSAVRILGSLDSGEGESNGKNGPGPAHRPALLISESILLRPPV